MDVNNVTYGTLLKAIVYGNVEEQAIIADAFITFRDNNIRKHSAIFNLLARDLIKDKDGDHYDECLKAIGLRRDDV